MPTNMGIKDLVCVNVVIDGKYEYQEPGVIVSKTGPDTYDVMVFGRDGLTHLHQNLTAGNDANQFTVEPR